METPLQGAKDSIDEEDPRVKIMEDIHRGSKRTSPR